MYNAIIVDDEHIIRDAISQTIDWNKHQFNLVATCSNALEAIEIIKTTNIDLVITDICMPHMDGLELSSYLYDNYPQISIVIISGYDDFNYAKEAIKYNVSEYLLKPVTAAEFNNILTKIRQELDSKKEKEDYLQKMKQIYNENLSNIKSRFLEALITPNSLSAEYISAKIEEFKPNLEGPYYCCVIFEAVPNKGDASLDTLSYFSLFSTVKDIIGSVNAGEVFQNFSNETIAYFSAESPAKLKETTKNVCSEIHKIATSMLSIRLNVCIGMIVYSLHKLSVSYQSASSLKEKIFLSGSNQIVEYSQVQENKTKTPINRTEWTNNILSCIKENKLVELDFLIEQLIAIIKNQQIIKSKAILDIQSIVLSILNFLEHSFFESDTLLEDEQIIFDKLASNEPLDDIVPSLKNFCHNAAAAIHTKKEDYNKTQAKLALDYISKNYSNPDITLSDICNHLSMSTSRFSAIFKANTGETFVEALTRVRMEAAKQLMAQTSMKAYEIAEKVGFTDSHYFGIAFKKYAKMTPTQYIKSLKEQ